MRDLTRLRRGVFSEEKILEEFNELKVALDVEPEAEKARFTELFRGINRKRTLIVMTINFFLHAIGQAFAGQYGAMYVKMLGTFNPFGSA